MYISIITRCTNVKLLNISVNLYIAQNMPKVHVITEIIFIMIIYETKLIKKI